MTIAKPIVLSVIIPAHNEELSIAAVVTHVSERLTREPIPHEIVVVDDHSTDATRSVVDGLHQHVPNIRCISNQDANGFGLAVRAGLDAYTGDAVAIMMADESDSTDDLVRYYEEICRGAECVFGSRFMAGSQVIDYPWLKLAINRCANFFIRLLFGIPLNDTTNAFKCYRREVIDGVRPLLSKHFNLTVELPLKAIARGFKFTVIPISWRNRQQGVSKLKLQEMGSRYLFIVLYIWLERMLTRGDYLRPAGHTTPIVPVARRRASRAWMPLAIAAALALLPFLVLSHYNRPIVDDFLFAKQVEVSGYFATQWAFYHDIYGRFTALALLFLNPMTRGPQYIWFLRFTPIAFITGLVAATFYLARSRWPAREARGDAVALAGALVTAYVAGMESPWQGFYWWSSQCCFELGNILTAFTIGQLLRLGWRERTFGGRGLAIAMALGVITPGANELTALHALATFGLISAVCFVRFGMPRRYWWLASAAIAGGALALLAPGNLHKLSYSAGYPLQRAMAEAVVASPHWIGQWLSGSMLPIVSIAVLGISVRRTLDGGPERRGTWVSVVGAVMLVWSAVFFDLLFLYKSVGVGPHPARAMNTAYFFFLLLWFFVLDRAAAVAAPALRWLAGPRTAIATALLAAVLIVVRPNNVKTASEDLLSGRAATYASEADARFDAFMQSPLPLVEVDPYSAHPTTIMDPGFELTDDVRQSINGAIQNYFGKSGVRVARDRRLTAIERAFGTEVPPTQDAFLFAPNAADRQTLVPLTVVNAPRFIIGDAPAFAARLIQRPVSTVFIAWEAKDNDSAEAKLWRSKGTVRMPAGPVTVAAIDAAGFSESLRDIDVMKTRDALTEISAVLKQAAGDPFRLWNLLQTFSWVEKTQPSLHQQMEVALASALGTRRSTGQFHEVYRGARFYGLHYEALGQSHYRLDLLFETLAPILEDCSILVHVIPPPEEVAHLPAHRQQFHFDDWSFWPQPSTKTWKTGAFTMTSTEVTTDLRVASVSVGLRSPTAGTLGMVEGSLVRLPQR